MKKQNLYILCGFPFSGKTTLAKELVKMKGWKRIDLDEVKLELYSRYLKDEQLGQNQWDEVYREMYQRIESSLKNGETVVHDTGNFTKHERALVRQIAARNQIPCVVIWVNVPVEVARERRLTNTLTKDRFDVCEAAFEEAVAEMEPPTDDERVLVYDGSTAVRDWIEANFTESSARSTRRRREK